MATTAEDERARLDRFVRDAACELPRSARRLTLRALLDPGHDLSRLGLPLMPGATFRNRVYLAKKSTGGFLWFASKKGRDEPLIDATLSFEILPAAAPAPPPPPWQDLELRAALPAFLNLGPDALPWNDYCPDGTKPSESLVLRLGKDGQDVLGFRIQKKKNDSAIRSAMLYRPENGPPVPMIKSQKWLIDPFIRFVDALETWLQNKPGSLREIVVADLENRLEKNDFTRLAKTALKMLINALHGVSDSNDDIRERPGLSPALKTVLPFYQLAHAEARLLIMVDENGELPDSRGDQRNQIAVTIGLLDTPTERYAHARVQPPDFLASGALRERFLDLLASDAFSDDSSVKRAFDLEAEAISNLFRSPEHRVSIFRTKRKSNAEFDTNIVLIRGAGQLRLLSGKFKYDATESRFQFKTGSAELNARTNLDSGNYGLDTDSVAHFYRIACLFRQWLSTIA